MGKYRMIEAYGFEEPTGFTSIRTEIDDELQKNKQTDEKQSQDITTEGETRSAADAGFEERITALEQQGGGDTSQLQEDFDTFTGTTYANDKAALEGKDEELDGKISDEETRASEKEAELESAIETLNGEGEGSVKKTAEDAAAAEVAKVVAEAPEDLDTLKEVADYIAADKTKAAEIETKLSDLEDKDDVLQENIDNEQQRASEAEEALQAAIDGKAAQADLDAEAERAQAAEEAIDAKVDSKADNGALEAEVARALAKEGELLSAIAEKASNSDLSTETERAQAAEEAIDAKVDAKADAATMNEELTALKNKDIELDGKNASQDEEIAKKVEWTESTPGRNHIVLKNHDSVLGTSTDGTTYNLAMVSKWDVADFGTPNLHLNLNTSDAVTVNDNKVVATEDVVDAKIAEIQIPDVSTFAVKSEVTEEINAVSDALSQFETQVANDYQPKGEYLTEESLEGLAKSADVDAALEGKADKTELEGLAESTAVTAEIAAAVAPLAVKTEVTEEVNAVSDALSQFETQVANDYQPKGEYLTEESIEGLAESTAVTAEIAAAVAGINVVLDAKADKSDLDGLAEASAVTEEIATAVAPLAVKAEVTEEINAVHDELTGEITKIVGTAPENFDTLEELAAALSDLKVIDVPAVPGEHYTQEEIDAAQEGDDAYGKTTDDWKVEPVEEVSHNMTIGEFVTTMMESVDEKPEVAAINEKMNAMENAMKRMDPSAYQTMMNDLEVLDTLKEANAVTIEEGTIADIVIPETTRSKTVNGELDPNSTLTLNSRYGVTVNNTSTGATNLNVTAPAVDGYNAATITLNDGEYDTVTVTNASLTVNTGASLQNVVITEDNTKSTTINAMFADGATVTSYSDQPITVNNKNAVGEEASIVLNAPGSTVTMSGGKWSVVTATVADDTLIIKGGARIANLILNQGHAIVEVPTIEDIATVIASFDPANPIPNVDYLKKEISQDNVADMQSTGECTLLEDVTRNGNFSVGTFSSDNIVWKLNGHHLTVENTRGFGGFRLRGSAKLAVYGEGTMTVSDDYALWSAISNGKNTAIIVNGGNFEAATHVLYAEKGVIEVNGGTFKLTNPDECDKDANGNFKFLLNCLDSAYTAGNANIIVRGGKFYGFNPAEAYGEPSSPVSYVADGYHVVESVEDGMKVFEVVAD